MKSDISKNGDGKTDDCRRVSEQVFFLFKTFSCSSTLPYTELSSRLGNVGGIESCIGMREEATEEAPAPKAAVPNPYAGLTVCNLQLGTESDRRTVNTATFIETAKELGVTLIFSVAQQKQENKLLLCAPETNKKLM